jgi:NAD(P)H-dependent flavin oxidoreductase YrpB (nitropropane dioxygenase family)
MRRTPLCELLDIELPVLGAPMGPEIASLELAAAVSNAGGLRMISFGGYPPARLKEGSPPHATNPLCRKVAGG